MKLAILDDWFDTLRGLPCFKKLTGIDVTVFTDHVSDVVQLADRLKSFDAIALFRERTVITAALLDQLPNLRLISQYGAFPHVDIKACSRNGVMLCSNQVRNGLSYAAPEHSWALIMAAMRQIPQQMASMQSGHWQMGVGKTLYGRILGLYGYGRIAKRVEVYANAFGMRVIWWASPEGRVRALKDGKVLAKNREDFFSAPDVVSIHVRLKPATRGLITRNDLFAMRKDAIFVNTSRAELIEAGAMLAALNHGRPGMAALDVFDQEPITRVDDELVMHPNIICTPHIGFMTEDELEIQFSGVFDQVVAYVNKAPIHVVNPEVV